MCTDISNVLAYSRPAETVFDIIFVINMIMSLITYNGKTEFIMTNDLKPVYKEIALQYLK